MLSKSNNKGTSNELRNFVQLLNSSTNLKLSFKETVKTK